MDDIAQKSALQGTPARSSRKITPACFVPQDDTGFYHQADPRPCAPPLGADPTRFLCWHLPVEKIQKRPHAWSGEADDDGFMKIKRPTENALTLPKSSTGITGLDEITGGGLPSGRPTLVYGSAGCGKTLLGLDLRARKGADGS